MAAAAGMKTMRACQIAGQNLAALNVGWLAVNASFEECSVRDRSCAEDALSVTGSFTN